MKNSILAFLSTAAICAFLSAGPVAAQETITGAPAGEAPITAEPPYVTNDNGSANQGTVGATQSDPRCHVTRDFYGSHGRYTSVCDM
jgi:hypothetical protein